MMLAFLAALAVAAPAPTTQAPMKPLKEIASTAALCVGWTNVRRLIDSQDTFSAGDISEELGERDAQPLLRTLVAGDVTVTQTGRCGRPLPLSEKEKKKIRYPDDFRLPHATVLWTTGGVKHVQILVYTGPDEYGRYRFLLLTRDFGDR